MGALGTDSGGSIRMPSAFCGTTGLRPRMGIVPLDRTVPFSWSHDTVGPMARTATDVAILWRVMSGSPLVAPRPLAGLRVAAPAQLSAVLDPDPEVEAAVEAALDVMVEHGAVRLAAAVPPFAEWDKDRFAIVQSDLLAAHLEAGWYPERTHLYGADLREYLARAETIRGADLVLARRRLAPLAARFMAALDDADVLVIPTAVVVAPHADLALREDVGQGPGVSPLIARLIRTCAPASYCGLVAASVPAGLSGSGLPIGLQVIGRDEATVLSAAMAFQEVTGHHRRRPAPEGFLDLAVS
jgi:aspartyl-tRNA(Asn)/glutamyl-tRNA(Gln) amidotransferase subunit A